MFGWRKRDRRLAWRLSADGALEALDPRDGTLYRITMNGSNTRLDVRYRYRPTAGHSFIGAGASGVRYAAKLAEGLAWPIR